MMNSFLLCRSAWRVAGGAVIAASLAHPAAQAPQVFRTNTDVITVDVAVRTGGTPVAGLTPEDFLVLDNGVPQRVDSLDTEAVPVDVTIIADTNKEVHSSIDDINGQAKDIASRLRPDDELRLLRIESYVTEILPMTRSASQPPLPRMPMGNLASVNDAIAAALMFEVPLNRRHLIIAITNGIDTSSVLTAETVRDIARQSVATLHIAQVDMAMGGSIWTSRGERERNFKIGLSLREQPHELFWQPHYAPPIVRQVGVDRFPLLREAAKLTGGDLHEPGLFVRNASDVFENAFKDFRQNYLLRYTPQGVTRVGWHTLKVTIPKYPGYTIHARSGYAIER